MAFIIKNVRNRVVFVGGVALKPGDKLRGEVLTDAINDAADSGDITITDAAPTAAELKSDADAIQDGVDKMKKILDGG